MLLLKAQLVLPVSEGTPIPEMAIALHESLADFCLVFCGEAAALMDESAVPSFAALSLLIEGADHILWVLLIGVVTLWGSAFASALVAPGIEPFKLSDEWEAHLRRRGWHTKDIQD